MNLNSFKKSGKKLLLKNTNKNGKGMNTLPNFQVFKIFKIIMGHILPCHHSLTTN